MEVQDRGSSFTVDGNSLDKVVFRKLVVEVVESSVSAVTEQDVSQREPIAQRDGLVAYPPHRTDDLHCVIADGEDYYEAAHRMELLRILQRI